MLPLIRDLELEDKKVLLRLDLNVPLSGTTITSDARIRAALPTIQYALDAGARVTLCSHLGRPKGERVPELSMEPVAERVQELLDRDVLLSEESVGDGAKATVAHAPKDAVVMLENLRFYPEETKGDVPFGRSLGAPFDAYVNDAFGTCHRAHASVVHVACPQKAAGFLLQKEVEALSRLLKAERKGFAAFVGGAKVSDKLGVLEALVTKADKVCVGGAMAYTFLVAQGHEVGTSRVEESMLKDAKRIMLKAEQYETEILLPVDHVCAAEFSALADPLLATDIPEGTMGLDIGPETRKRYEGVAAAATNIFWNGPMGVFEWGAFAEGTLALAGAVAGSKAYSVVGGGDSVAAIEKAGLTEGISHISTGGGASLEFIERKGALPGIVALAD